MEKWVFFQQERTGGGPDTGLCTRTLQVPETVPALAGRLPVALRFREQAGELAALLYADGEVIRTQPLFEPQPRLDPEAGVLLPAQVPEPEKILAVYQHKTWWTRPAFPSRCADIPDRTQLLLLRYPEGTLCILAVTDEIYRCDLLGGKDWNLQIRCRSGRTGDSRIHTLCAAMAWDRDPYEAVRRAVTAAAAGRKQPVLLRQARHYPEIFEGFGWCTWDAFYHGVSEEGIFRKLEELRGKGVPAPRRGGTACVGRPCAPGSGAQDGDSILLVVSRRHRARARQCLKGGVQAVGAARRPLRGDVPRERAELHGQHHAEAVVPRKHHV